MQKAILTCFFLSLLYGFGHGVSASYNNGGSLDYVPSSQNFGIHTMVVPEALTLNGYFALKEQTSDDAPLSGYGNLYAKAGGLYYYNGSSAFWITNGSTAGAGASDLNGLSDAVTTSVSVYLGSGSGDSSAGTTYNTALGIESLQAAGAGVLRSTAVGYQTLNSTSSADDNVAIGYHAMRKTTSGAKNVSLGSQSMNGNTSGFDNIAIGYKALFTNTSGFENTAVGYSSMYSDTSGFYNTALGKNSMYSNTSGMDNTALGYQAMYSGVTAYANTAIGSEALYTASSGNYNTATGYRALYNNESGGSNTATGGTALIANTTGGANAAHGVSALSSNTTGNNNSAFGYYSLIYPVTGSRNTAVGTQAGEGTWSNSFSNGTFLGYKTGVVLTTGDNNILLGYQAGDNITTGDSNIIIGYDIDAPSATADEQMSIGNLIYATGIDGTGTTVSSGNVGIGNGSPAAKLDVNGGIKIGANSGSCASSNSGEIRYNGTSANMEYCNGSAWTAISDSTSGGRLLLETQTANGSSAIQFTSNIDSTYSRYEIEITAMTTSIDAAVLYSQMSTDGGTSWNGGAAEYTWGIESHLHWSDTADSKIILNYDNCCTNQIGNSSGEHYNGTCELINAADSTQKTMLQCRASYIAADSLPMGADAVGYFNSISVVNGIQFYLKSGNISTGTFKLYGVP